MSAYLRPGVYVQESLNPTQVVPVSTSTAIAAFAGANDRGPVLPTLVTSWNQYVTLFGSWNTVQNNNLPLAVYLFFANGGSQCYVNRVVSTSATATVTAASASGGTVTYTAANSFSAGQTVSITGLSTTAFNLSNVTIATASGTQFTVINPATGTAVTGASGTATVSGAIAASRTLTDNAATPLATMVVSANSAGAWGNNISVEVVSSSLTGYFTLNVYYAGVTSANIVERWTDITMLQSDPRYAINVINSASNYITVVNANSTTTAPNNNPKPVLPASATLASGSDGSSVTSANITTSLNLYDTIKSSLVLNLPGYTDATTINAAIAYATGSTRTNDVFVVVDGVNDTVANQLTLASSYTATSQAAVYYPQITIADPTLGVGAGANSTKTIGAGGAVAGLYAATDASRGVFKAPAGLQARVAGAVSVPSLANADLDSLNSAAAPVNAIKFVPGAGIVVMGARTLKPGYIDRYVPVRRTLIFLEKSLTDLTQFAIFEPNDQRLWRRLNATVSSFLTNFWSQGGLSGTTPAQAFFVKVDSTNNTQTTINNGEVHIEVGVALQRPAEFVVIKIGQFDGGTTVTVS
jgi:hypothetical protein